MKDEPRSSPPQRRQLQAVGEALSGAYTALSAVIESSKDDPAQLRRLVYELARSNLERQACRTDPPLNPSEIVDGTRALEAVIARIEAEASQQDRADFLLTQLYGPVASDESTSSFLQSPTRADFALLEPIARREEVVTQPLPVPLSEGKAGSAVVLRERERLESKRPPRRIWLWFILWPMVQFAGGPILGLALKATTVPQNNHFVQQSLPAPEKGLQTAELDVQRVESSPTRGPDDLPIPTVYGLYALNDGKLYELEPLPIRVPDARIQLSAEISAPSRTILPDGKVTFIIFRRELVNNAPEKMSVRVVARIAREMVFTAGKATTTQLAGAWRIRSNSFSLKVSPLATNREIIVIRPEADFLFPAGRYVLVYNNQGYDFTVGGTITAGVQCLERIEAANGTVYTECRNP